MYYIASSCYKRFPQLFREWEKVRHRCQSNLSKIRRQSNICSVILWSYVLADSAFSAFLIFSTNYMDMYLVPLTSGYIWETLLKVFNVITLGYLVLGGIGPSVLMLMVVNILSNEFEIINDRLRSLIAEGSDAVISNIEAVRSRHQALCKLVDRADNIF